MTTPALPVGYLTRMRSLTQAVKWSITLSEIRQFRAFCCSIDSHGIEGVAKQPVVHLDINTPVCLGDTVTWDFAGSYAPGSTVTSYAIDMGDGTSYWTQTGSHTYAAVGTYTVHATVTEGTGRYTTNKYEVEVVDCTHPMAMRYAYTAYDGGGVYFMDFTVAVPVWAARNTGLTGFSLYVRDLGLRPHTKSLSPRVHELWACTYGGVFRSFNGGLSWRKMNLPDPSNAEFGDTPPAVIGELDFYNVVFDPKDKQTVYILAAKTSASRLWIYKTGDLGVTWTSRGVVAS